MAAIHQHGGINKPLAFLSKAKGMHTVRCMTENQLDGPTFKPGAATQILVPFFPGIGNRFQVHNLDWFRPSGILPV